MSFAKAAFSSLALGLLLLTSCTKDEERGTEESYTITGAVNTTRSTATGTAVVNLGLVNNGKSPASDGGRGVLSGTISWAANFTSTPDSLWLYANKADGSVASYLTIVRTVLSTNTYTFTNAINGSLVLNLPLTVEGTDPFVKGGGYIKVGKSGRYLFIDLNNVRKN